MFGRAGRRLLSLHSSRRLTALVAAIVMLGAVCVGTAQTPVASAQGWPGWGNNWWGNNWNGGNWWGNNNFWGYNSNYLGYGPGISSISGNPLNNVYGYGWNSFPYNGAFPYNAYAYNSYSPYSSYSPYNSSYSGYNSGGVSASPTTTTITVQPSANTASYQPAASVASSTNYQTAYTQPMYTFSGSSIGYVVPHTFAVTGEYCTDKSGGRVWVFAGAPTDGLSC